MSGPGSREGAPLVAHLISSKGGVGGAEKVVAALAIGAEAHGWRASIVNPFAGSSDSREFEALYGVVPYHQRATQALGQLPRARAWAASALRGLGPRLVHVHLYHATLLAATMAPPAGASWLLTHHYGPLFNLQRRYVHGTADRWAVRRLGRAVAISTSVRDYLVEGCHLPEGHVTLIHNGWGGQPQAAYADRLPPTAVCVANFRKEKGHEVLVRAFAEVVRQLPNARLVLVGRGPFEDRARAQVSASGLTSSVDFLGTLGDVWPILAAAHVFVLSSWYEPFGVAVLEAMAAGLPVVATSTGGVRELVQQGTTGWLVPPGDHAELARRITQVLTDDNLRRDFGRSAAQAAAERSEASMVARYYDLYNTLVAS